MENLTEVKEMHLQQKIKELVDGIKDRKDMTGGRNAYFSFLHADGTAHTTAGPCHGTVLTYGLKHTCVAIITKINREKDFEFGIEQSPHTVKFYDWLFNRSPFAQCFMYKSASAQFERVFTPLTTKVPSNLLQAALITSRNTWEYKQHIELWTNLVDRGVNENLAYFVAHFLSGNGDELTTSSITGEHTAVGCRATVKGARAYTRNLTPNELKTLYISGKDNGGGVHSLWMFPNDREFSVHFKEQLRDWLAGGAKTANTNPFHRAKPKKSDYGIQVKLNQLAQFLIERETQLLGED